jgi:urease accessory protein
LSSFLFKALPIVRSVSSEALLPAAAAGYSRATVTLGWDERLRARGRRLADNGVEFGTVLPRGTILRQGDCLVLDELQTVLIVVEREEPVLMVEPATAHECGLYAYHLGNSHQPIMFAGGAIVCPDLPGVRQVLDHHRIPFSAARRPFTPVGFVPDHRH